MNPPPVTRRVLLVIAVLLLLGLAWTGVSGGLRQLRQAQGLGQHAQTWAQLIYGVLSVLSILTTFQGRRWALLVLACWAGSVTLAAGLAPVVWGGTGWLQGVFAGGAALLIASGVIWLLRMGG